MPFLRFSKDRRGYENTFLLHSSRRRNDKDRPTLLYWFRTPPHVKVGRAAFDESAIRALEDQHPGVEFDWPRILATRPPDEVLEQERPKRPSARRSTPQSAAPAVPSPTAPTATQDEEPESAAETVVDAAVPAPPGVEPVSQLVTGPSEDLIEPPAEPSRRFFRVFDRETEADPEPQPAAMPHHLSEPAVVERMLGSDQLGRLRGQYAAALARIGRRITDPALAERINPDAWVTEDDVRQGLQGVLTVQEELARHVGRRRRRRRRGRIAGGPVPGQPAPGDLTAAAPDEDSEAGPDSEEEEDDEAGE